jgi:hypothetical protein
VDGVTERLLESALGFGPFSFRERLVKKYEAELNLDAFKKEMSGEFFLESLSERKIDSLYELCLEARVQRELMAKARSITGRDSWRRSRQTLDKLTKSLREYKNTDIEKRLRNNLGGGDSVTLSSTKKLVNQLADLGRTCEWWEGFANWDVWGAFYRGYVFNMDRLLGEPAKSKVRRKNNTGSKQGMQTVSGSKEQALEMIRVKEQRAAIIAAAILWMGVESRASSDSVLRALSREAGDPRRFVFSGPVIALESVDETDKALAKFLKKWSKRGSLPSPARKTRSSGPRRKSSKRTAGQFS